MQHPTNNYIGSLTRSFLAVNAHLKGKDFDTVESVLSKIRSTSPSGMIYDLARSCGADEKHSEYAAVSVELFYAACSLTDDIQDEEAEYAGESVATQVNAQSMIICASFMSLSRLSACESFGCSGIKMLTGQSIELSQAGQPTIETYSEISECIAGAAFESYFGLIATALIKTTSVYVPSLDIGIMRRCKEYGRALGNLIQVVTDQESKDERWLGIDVDDQAQYLTKVLQEYKKASIDMPVALQNLTKSNLGRFECAFSVKSNGANT